MGSREQVGSGIRANGAGGLLGLLRASSPTRDQDVVPRAG